VCGVEDLELLPSRYVCVYLYTRVHIHACIRTYTHTHTYVYTLLQSLYQLDVNVAIRFSSS
jgi:hypothetical protein